MSRRYENMGATSSGISSRVGVKPDFGASSAENYKFVKTTNSKAGGVVVGLQFRKEEANAIAKATAEADIAIISTNIPGVVELTANVSDKGLLKSTIRNAFKRVNLKEDDGVSDNPPFNK